LNFQAYYNRLVSKVLELEEEKHHDYYRALPIADKYMTLMDSYNMVQSENRGQIIEAIKAGTIELYLENMELIMSHHIVDEKAKAEINALMDRMKYFLDEGHWISERENEECSEKSQAIEVMPPELSVIPMGCIPQIPMFQAGVMPIVGNMYFSLQCLNENHEIVDEANFSTGNMSLAMQDYNNRKAYIKRFGLVQDGKFMPLLTSEKGED